MSSELRLELLRICFRMDLTIEQNIERAKELETYALRKEEREGQKAQNEVKSKSVTRRKKITKKVDNLEELL